MNFSWEKFLGWINLAEVSSLIPSSKFDEVIRQKEEVRKNNNRLCFDLMTSFRDIRTCRERLAAFNILCEGNPIFFNTMLGKDIPKSLLQSSEKEQKALFAKGCGNVMLFTLLNLAKDLGVELVEYPNDSETPVLLINLITA